MTRVEKTKARSTRKDPSGFEHVDAAIQASRGGKHKAGRGGRGGAVTARGKAIRKKQKNKELTSVIVGTIDANIQTLNQGFNDIEEDVRGIITRQTVRRAAGATKTSATFKGAIHVDDEDETNEDGDGDADSDDDWMYD
jgi:hypothetical protein